MNGNFLLDTNIVIAIFAQEKTVLQRLAEADQVFVSSIVLGELYYGAQKSGRRAENITRVDEFAASNAVLDCTTRTANIYGEVKNRLRAKGRPLPENDIWIASLAIQYGLTLVTRDSHFTDVDNLSVETW
jgi:tRNA(fMet)-specific endonuclease VapC